MKKKMMTVAVALGLTMVVAAQRGHGIASSRVVIVSPGIGFGYSPFGYSPFGYSAFGYPYGYPYGNSGYRRVSKLQLKVEDIKMDYKDKIKSARHDKSLNRDERKTIVRQLRMDRDKAVHEAKVNYYKPVKPAPGQDDKG